MNRQTNTRKAQIEALTAQSALLAASLEQAKAQATAKATQAAAIAFDCAETLSEQSNWLLALFQAIGHYTSASEATNLGSTHTANQLAAIGSYLADTGYESAQDIQMQVKGVT
jgi:hypothetical protein